MSAALDRCRSFAPLLTAASLSDQNRRISWVNPKRLPTVRRSSSRSSHERCAHPKSRIALAIRSRADKASTHLRSLILQVDDLAPRAEETTRLKDQMDEYRHAAEKAKKSEAVLEKYRKKLEEAGDLRRSLKVRRVS